MKKNCLANILSRITHQIYIRIKLGTARVNIAATYIRFFFESVFVTKCHFFFWVKKKKFFFIFFYSKKNENFFIFFYSKKIVAFAFHFLSDFSRQSKSKISFFPFVKILSRKNLLICFSLSLRSKIWDLLICFSLSRRFPFLPLHWSSLPKICIESQNRKNQISEIQIQLIFST